MANKLFSMYAFSASVGGETTVCKVLARELRLRGWDVDLVTRGVTPYERPVVDGPNIIRLKKPLIPSLARYVEEKKPVVLMSFDELPNFEALIAHYMSGTSEKIIIRYDCLLDTPHIPKKIYYRLGIRTKLRRVILNAFLISRATAIIGVSDGIADSIKQTYKVDHSKVIRLYNPLDLENIRTLSEMDCSHPWFDEDVPVIVSVCRLDPEKNLSTMLKAFAIALQSRPLRLIMVGIGTEEAFLKKVASDLGISESVSFEGYVVNQYPYMSMANVFAMSSISEGLGCSLQEAMACGTTIVSTDYPYGARELLQGGEYGTLVPVQDLVAMAEAFLHAVDNPQDPDKLLARVQEFDVKTHVDQLLSLIGE